MRAVVFLLAILCGGGASAIELSFGRYLPLEDELLYQGKPSSSDYTAVIYGGDNWTIYGQSFSFPQGTDELPTQASVEAACITAAASSPVSITLDIESWPGDTQAERLATRDKAATVLKWCVDAIPQYNGRVGFYGIAPGRDYFNAIDCDIPEDAGCAAWRANNDDLNFSTQLIAQGIRPMMFPSVYLFYSEAAPYTDMVQYLSENIGEARRLCPTCEVSCFIWPQFHDGGPLHDLIATISTDKPSVMTLEQDASQLLDGMEVRIAGKTKVGATVTIANPAVVTWASHGLGRGSRITWTTTGALPTGLVVGTNYFVRGPQTSTFYLSEAPLGTVTFTVASPAVFTKTNHGLTNGTPVFIHGNVMPNGVNQDQVLYVQNPTTDTFTLSQDVGGAVPVNTTSAGAGTHYVSKAVVTSGTQSGTHTVYWGPASINGQLFRIRKISNSTFRLFYLNGAPLDGAALAAPPGGNFHAEIPYGQWKKLLETVYVEADRCVMWGGYLVPWVKDSSWWKATRDFIKGR